MQHDDKSPWFFYDYVNPAPQFRQMGEDYDFHKNRKVVDVSEGEDLTALSDNPGVGRKPVQVPGYE